MSLEIDVEQQSHQHTLEIATEAPMWKIPKVLAESFGRIKSHAETHGANLAGAPYARYLDIDWETVRTAGAVSQIWKLLTHKQKLRAGFPVSGAIAGASNIESVELAPGRCVRAVHRGPIHKIGATYKLIAQWSGDQPIRLANHTIESYITDPGKISADKLETLILIPTADESSAPIGLS